MSENRSSLSGARSYEEMGEYWDSHDVGEVWDQTRPVEFEVNVKSERHYFPIERELSQRLARAAEAQGVSAETLINLWVQEKLAHSGS
jgi:hypothetical protein